MWTSLGGSLFSEWTHPVTGEPIPRSSSTGLGGSLFSDRTHHKYRGVLQDQLETGRVAAKFRKDWMKREDFVSAQEAEEMTEIRM